MNREFEFFITEYLPQVNEWAKQKKCDGGILVGSADQLLEELDARTQPHDDISCRISGAWLDQCVQNAVRGLLFLESHPNILRERTVSSITVDLSTSVVYGEHVFDLSIEERRGMFTRILGDYVNDARLTILPERSE